MSNSKKYYDTHKEELKEKRSILVECECGKMVKKGHMSTHRKTKKHLLAINPDVDPYIKCECGYILLPNSMYTHLSSNYHIFMMSNKCN